jgi:hypothetical protein
MRDSRNRIASKKYTPKLNRCLTQIHSWNSLLTFEIDWELTFAENYLKELLTIQQPIAKSYQPKWRSRRLGSPCPSMKIAILDYD